MMKASRAGRGSRLRVRVGVGREKGRCAVQRSRRRGCGPAALLAAMLLMNSCIQLADAVNTVIPITMSPPKPTEGFNIFLIPGLDCKNFTSCGWYRGSVLASENLRLIISSQSKFYNKGDAYTGGLHSVPTNQPEDVLVDTDNRCRNDKNSAPDEASSEPPFSVCDNTFPPLGLKMQNSSPCTHQSIMWSSHLVIPAGDIPPTTPIPGTGWHGIDSEEERPYV
ncbi:uncharacterized protein LOC113445970 [Pseudonaja textilis]|uniref:uncharacterized protein LOC113445970 n=1 Tax=Pseudonaja textilis TaxID=8673 RepID=UPI000EAA4133|nr:uncharacterized protein LOC113445970 [Pseudonaja textilis]